jgi:DNA polymerase-3 subunit delta
MKLSYFQLEPQIAKKLAAIYVISGDELLLKQDAINLIRKAATASGFSERIRLTPESGLDGEQLYTMLYSPSMLAEKQLIELAFRETFLNKAVADILQQYAENPSPNHLLLLDIAKADAKIAKSAWYQTLEKAGVLVTIWPIPREQLPQWIINRAKKYKLQVAVEGANLLADYVEGNLVAAAQTLEKIYLLRPQQVIDATLLQTILTDESHFTVFDFIDAIIGRDKTRAFHILASLKKEGTEPVLLLWGIARELRLLITMAQQLQQGVSYETLFQKHRIFPRRERAIRRFLSGFSEKEGWHYLAQAAEIDKTIKGGAPGNVWDALQLLCLRMA